MALDESALRTLLTMGVQHGASDIHFRPGAPPMYRVKGQLLPLKSEPLTATDTATVAGLIAKRYLDPQAIHEVDELDTSYQLSDVARFRVNIYHQRGTLALVLRIIPKDIKPIAQLGLPDVVERIALVERGLVLVTGATGAGKTTTLAAMIDAVNQRRSNHIVTIEDPIEFLHINKRSSISQREIGIDTRSYVTGLRSALRQDPDVILVGEMRDAESIDIALKAAETGHVVFSTVHTIDAAKTLHRIVSVFPAEEQTSIRLRVADSLQAVISQRLVPRADNRGMVVACEVMINTGTVRDVIVNPGSGDIRAIIEDSRGHYGTQSFDQHLTDLFRAGVITREVAMRTATRPADFERNLEFA